MSLTYKILQKISSTSQPIIQVFALTNQNGYQMPKSPFTFVSSLYLQLSDNPKENDITEFRYYIASNWKQQTRVLTRQVHYFLRPILACSLLLCFPGPKAVVSVFSCQHPLLDGVRTQYVSYWEMASSGTKQNSVKTVSIKSQLRVRKHFIWNSKHQVTLAKIPVKLERSHSEYKGVLQKLNTNTTFGTFS